MSDIRTVKTNFTSGEVSPMLLGRGDLRAYDNGAATLQNVFIQPTGGVTRRAGMRYVDTARGPGRLVSFQFNTDQTYLLILTAGKIDIYADDALIATLDAPWTAAQIDNVVWTQSADTMLLVHPDIPPKSLTRTDSGFALADWEFYVDDTGAMYQPYFKFAPAAATLAATGTSGSVTITASAAVFADGHVGTRLRIGGDEVLITAFNSPTVVTASVVTTLSATAATIDWQEQSFSPVRGYPSTVAFDQGRLIIGGSRDLPNRMWFSKSNDLFNFDLGTGLDDEAIEFAILSDQVDAIRGLFSGRDFQVFTSGAEWMVSGSPLTPTSIQITRQTRVGSMTNRYVPPINIDGATMFIARNGQQVCEFVFTELEQAYQTTDLALLSHHLIVDPVDQDYDALRRLLFLVRADGTFLTLTVYRAEEVTAWTEHRTNGQILSVAVVGEDVYMLVDRGGAILIERLDDALNLDAALDGAAATPAATWSGLDHLEGQSVSIVADGVVQPARIVHAGSITLDAPASHVVIGLPFTHIVEPLPPSLVEGDGAGRKARLVEAAFRLEQSAALTVDVGLGLRDVPLRRFGETVVAGAPPPVLSRDIRVRALGWKPGGSAPLWRIEQSVPLPFTLLSVTTQLKVNA